MNRTLGFVFILLAGCGSAGKREAPAVSRAPDFKSSTVGGVSVRGSSLWADDQVLLVFMTSW